MNQVIISRIQELESQKNRLIEQKRTVPHGYPESYSAALSLATAISSIDLEILSLKNRK
jgi:hypothetical protein